MSRHCPARGTPGSFGADYFNITANPRVELRDGTDTSDYDACAVFGDDRQIPVFVLTPAG